MTAADLRALLPLIVMAASALAAMAAITVRRDHLVTAAVTVAGLVLSLAALPFAGAATPRRVTVLLALDPFALFFIGLVALAGLAATLLAYGYLDRRAVQREEFYLLLLLAVLGASVLPAARHFASFFLALELLSVALYAMIAYLHTEVRSLEAGTKYLVLAGASSTFLAFGMALVYAATGRLDFAAVAGQGALVYAGFALIVVGIGFKLAVAPFHLWAPDVYQGASAPVTAFVATASKAAVVALFLRVLHDGGVGAATPTGLGLAVMAALSMILGNLLALRQDNVKRMLAYSSIAHLGYVLVAFLAGGTSGVQAAALYVAAYAVAALAAFGVVTVLSGPDGERERIEDYRGLFRRRPLVAGTMAAALLSLAGIPATAGFVGKFFLVAAGVEAALWPLLAILVATSVIGLYYYLRLLAVMFAEEPVAEEGPDAARLADQSHWVEPASASAPPVSFAGGLVLAAVALVLFWLGVYPSTLLDLVRAARMF